jgi:hypothetical protein
MLDFDRIAAELDVRGWALTGPALSPDAVAELNALYDKPRHFRKKVIMGRHGYGRGEYQYFADPLPEPVVRLRRELYPRSPPSPTAGPRRWSRTAAGRSSTPPCVRNAAPPARTSPPR